MDRALFTSATGLAAQQMNLDVIANNLANVSTVGFKSSQANFQDLMYQDLQDPGSQTSASTMLPTGTQVGLGVSAGTTSTINTTGTMQQTGNATDMAVQGAGFFQVLMPDGTTSYTRAGNFNVDGTGRLVNPQGYPLQPEIVVPPNSQSLTISPSGQVTVTVAGQTQPQVVGQVQLTTFVNPAGMRAMGGNLFQATAASGTPTTSNPGSQGAGTIAQDTLEESNVDIVSQMVQMIIVQRAYDSNSKVITSADRMMSTTNALVQ